MCYSWTHKRSPLLKREAKRTDSIQFTIFPAASTNLAKSQSVSQYIVVDRSRPDFLRAILRHTSINLIYQRHQMTAKPETKLAGLGKPTASKQVRNEKNPAISHRFLGGQYLAIDYRGD